jgi:hypothetical protein
MAQYVLILGHHLRDCSDQCVRPRSLEGFPTCVAHSESLFRQRYRAAFILQHAGQHVQPPASPPSRRQHGLPDLHSHCCYFARRSRPWNFLGNLHCQRPSRVVRAVRILDNARKADHDELGCFRCGLWCPGRILYDAYRVSLSATTTRPASFFPSVLCSQ